MLRTIFFLILVDVLFDLVLFSKVHVGRNSMLNAVETRLQRGLKVDCDDNKSKVGNKLENTSLVFPSLFTSLSISILAVVNGFLSFVENCSTKSNHYYWISCNKYN